MHSYVLYPILLRYFARIHTHNTIVWKSNETLLPHAIIVMAVYNEEKVIRQKLESVYATNYPLDKIELWIGSDNSTDLTNEIIQEFASKYGNIVFQNFEGRNGKVAINNQQIEQNKARLQKLALPVFVMTDANVFFTENTLWELLKHYKNPSIGVVGANILNTGVQQKGIAFQESWYIQRENDIKFLEGKWAGCMMGAFGACYALRASDFVPVPDNFIVDDFFFTLKSLEKGHWAIKEPKAICFEDVSIDIMEEFKRKKRISAGNFQNLVYFKHLLHPKNGPLAFAFLSHKVLRWLGPLFIISSFLCSLILVNKNYFFLSLLFLQVAGFLSPLLDRIINRNKIRLRLLRFLSYFYLMNAALLLGLFNYIKGIQSNVWKPTKRNL